MKKNQTRTGGLRDKREEPENLEEIILKYWPLISYRVRSSVGYSNPDCQDLGSEIILHVVEALQKKRFRNESSLGTYIYAITTKRIIDYIRRKKIPAGPLLDYPSLSDPLDSLERKERAGIISEALRKLKPKHADILYLNSFLGISQKEIARTYNLSPSRIHAIIKEATRRLKKIIRVR